MALKKSLFDWCMENDKQYLLDEWDYDKNDFLIPDYVSYLSDIVIDWKCKFGHTWEEPLCNRTKNGHVCKKCKEIKKKQIEQEKQNAKERRKEKETKTMNSSFAIMHPVETDEWLYSDDNIITPYNVLPASQKYATWRCRFCGHIWRTTFNNRHQGHGCKVCNSPSAIMKKSHKTFVDEVYQRNDNINVDETYIDSRTKIWFSCKQCGHRWRKSPENMLKYCICPICNKSKGEQAIYKVLYDNGLNFSTQYVFDDCRFKNPLPFDFCIFDDNNNVMLLIEYDGEQHFEPIEFFGGDDAFEITQRNDKIKNEYCIKNHIDLLRIPYFEFENIKTLIDNKIQEILNLSNKKLITESVQCASTLSEENFNKEGDQHGKT